MFRIKYLLKHPALLIQYWYTTLKNETKKDSVHSALFIQTIVKLMDTDVIK